eukprot:1815333-Alexandrium_andersonii.AAC.1
MRLIPSTPTALSSCAPATTSHPQSGSPSMSTSFQPPAAPTKKLPRQHSERTLQAQRTGQETVQSTPSPCPRMP